MLFSLLVALLTVLPPTRGLDLVNSSPDQSCSPQEVCATKSSCAHWVEREAQYKEGRDPSYLTDARAHICNKQLRALCCPRPPQLESPAFIPEAGQCGTNPEAPATPDSRFVFGGNNTDPGDYPFSALLGYTDFRLSRYISHGKRQNESFPVWICSGTLINQWFVLTAAHCLRSREKKVRNVRLGEWLVQDDPYNTENTREGPQAQLPDTQDFQVTERNFILYGGGRRYQDDLALIRLPRKAKLNAGTQLACLPLPGSAHQVGLASWVGEEVGRTTTVVGWGYSCYRQDTREFCRQSQQIATQKQQYLEVLLWDNSDCSRELRTKVTTSQVCAGGEFGQSACNGDSGGGLYIRRENDELAPWYLFGIVSFGVPNCQIAKPEVYVRVSEYIPWILEKIRENN